MATFGNSLLAGLSGMPQRAPRDTSLMAAVSQPSPQRQPGELGLLPTVPVDTGADLRGALVQPASAPPQAPVDPFAAASPSPVVTAPPPVAPPKPQVRLPAVPGAPVAAADPFAPSAATLDPNSDRFDPSKAGVYTGPQLEGQRLEAEFKQQRSEQERLMMEERQVSLEEQAEAQRVAIEQQQVAEKQRAVERQMWQSSYDDHLKKYEAAADEIANTTPSAGKFWGDAGFLGSIAAITAVGFGQYAAIKTGQPNDAAAALERALDRSLKEQAMALDNKRVGLEAKNTILGQMRAKFGDDEAAFSATKASMRELASQKFNEIATRFKGTEQGLIAEALGDEQKKLAEIAKNANAQTAANVALERKRAQDAAAAQAAAAQAAKLAKRDEKFADAWTSAVIEDTKENGGMPPAFTQTAVEIGGHTYAPGTLLPRDKDGNFRPVMGKAAAMAKDGTAPLAVFEGVDASGKAKWSQGSAPKDSALKLRDAGATAATIVQEAQSLENIANKFGSSASWDDNADARSGAVRLKMQLKNLYQLGVLSASDNELLDQLVPANAASISVTNVRRLSELARSAHQQYKNMVAAHTGSDIGGVQYGAPK